MTLSEPTSSVPGNSAAVARQARKSVVAAALALGAGLISLAFLVGQTVAAGLLTEAGVAIFLFLPLYWVQERSYRVVRSVETRQRESESVVATSR